MTKTIIVKGNVPTVYDLWTDFEYFPFFMENIESVRKTDDRTSHWTMEGPMGQTLQWETETTRQEENKRIAWRTLEGDIQTSGQVTFTALPQDQTQVTVTLQYVPPSGKIGEAIAKLVDNPERRLLKDLQNFKNFAENRPERLPKDQ
jgi:uncharacterized membrane protein